MEYSFLCLGTNKGLFETLTDKVKLPDRLTELSEDANDEQTRGNEEFIQARATAVHEIESRKTQNLRQPGNDTRRLHPQAYSA